MTTSLPEPPPTGAAQDKFSLLAGIASDWWWEMDADLRLTFLSERFTRVFGLPVDVAIGKLRTEIARTDYNDPSWKSHLEDLRLRRPFRDFETTVVDAKGVSRPITLSGTPIFGANGVFEGYLGVGHDLTMLRSREKEAAGHARNLEAILQNIDQGVVLIDGDLTIVAYNRRMTDLLELDPARDERGKPYEVVLRELAMRGEYAPEPVEAAIARRLEAARSPTPFVIERTRTDGRVVSASFAPLPGGGSVMTYTDITEARRREAKLAESEERFRHLFSHSPLPKWVYHTETLQFLEVNDAAVAKYGYSREEFLSMNLRDIRPPEDIPKVEQWMKRPPHMRHHAVDFRHRRKDGSLLDVEIFLRDLEFGGAPGRLSVVIDVTSRKEAERRVQRIFDTSQEVIFVTDGYGKFLQVSPSTLRTLGYTPEEMVGRNGTEFIFPDDLEPTRKEMLAARHGKTTTNFPCRYRHKDGSVVPLVWTGVWSEADRSHFFMGRDMSDYERSQAQLRQAQKMEAVGQLTGGVAHDFNNILMVIMARAEALEEEEKLEPSVIADIQAIRGATERAASLTRQLLAFSRKQPLRPEVTNINDLVGTTSKLLGRTLGENIQLKYMLADDLCTVEVDRAQIEAALVNLCINARDAMPGGGHLTVETGNVTLDEDYVANHPDLAAGEYAMLAVTDSGSGIAPEALEKVFEPFFTTKPMGKGTGLGLSMVYGFIKQSRGHVRIYSELGRGTTVKLFLPKVTGAIEGTTGPRAAPMPRGTERVLVVEDDPDVRNSVVQQVRSLGYEVAEASNAADGLSAVNASPSPFALLLTDVVMPGAMTGQALALEVGKKSPTTKIVFMSGYTDKAIIHQGRLDAGVLLLSKPFRKHELALILRKALDGAAP
jgi:PAS domain S-box-containing protein